MKTKDSIDGDGTSISNDGEVVGDITAARCSMAVMVETPKARRFEGAASGVRRTSQLNGL